MTMGKHPTIATEIPVGELHVHPGQSLIVIGYDPSGRGAKVYQLYNDGELRLAELKPTPKEEP